MAKKGKKDSFSRRLSDASKTGGDKAFPHADAPAPATKKKVRSPDNDSFSTRLAGASQKTPATQPAQPTKTPDMDSFSARLSGEMEEVQALDAPPAPAAEPNTLATGPVGTGTRAVRHGECVSSIAAESGHNWSTIWGDPANLELRETRQEPNVLLTRDRVTVPPIEPKYEPGMTEMRHRFVRSGEPTALRLRLRKGDGPLAAQPYELTLDSGTVLSGTTDAAGNLAAEIAGNARTAELVVGSGREQARITLQLGGTDPVSAVSGVQQRLNNLGYRCGTVTGRLNDGTRRALDAFQRANGLTVSGQIDEATRTKLKELHGS